MGRPATDLIDAGPVRSHIEKLRAGGMGWKRIADAASVSQGSLSKLLYGERGHGPTQRIKPGTAARLLAVECELAPNALIDSAGSVRRLRALVVVGWSQSRLAERLGWTTANISALIGGHRALITVRTAAGVRGVYDELWDAPPADGIRNGQDSVARARRLGERKGWAPPLAWDDDTIDDPASEPAACQRPARTTLHVDDIEWLRGTVGLRTTRQLAEHLGVDTDTVTTAVARAASRRAVAS